MFSKKIATMILGLSAAILTGCEGEQTEKDMIAEAQFCLDEARDAASANACMSKINGITSPNAYTLRCAAGFISSGITSAANLSSALTAISEGGGPTDMLTALSFDDVVLANNTANYCNQSGQKGLALIGAMAKSATALSNAANSLNLGSCDGSDISSCDPAAIENAISDILANPNSSAAIEAVEAIGSSIQTVYSVTCGGTNNANSDICGDINQAAATAGIDISTADISAIGQALLAQWNPTP
ncbi:hypothetical protein [Bdellovibrio bacteriovorus]|uniref:Lipoprotein n=1 Tax=Bdellovibrio bacteriovorus str. Tiberius TaxID=1069642 RepID=K7ZBZ0_BDEBC|nr:hypothetical protein [Bdellovibrio bacteriovorus]AFY02749.1 hypothetical protein Bdt_3074 [Bdellovibrio bacteriovorus str. Tiberius]